MPAIIVLVIAFLVGIVTHMPSSHTVNQPVIKGESTAVVSPTNTPAPTVMPTATPTAVPTFTPTPTIYIYPTATPTDSGLSSNDYYINSSGNEVHSPAYDNTVPTGATALCADGTYSFSQNRRGTCSHHGGVAQWL